MANEMTPAEARKVVRQMAAGCEAADVEYSRRLAVALRLLIADSDLLDGLENLWLENDDCPVGLYEGNGGRQVFYCNLRSGKIPARQSLREALRAALGVQP